MKTVSDLNTRTWYRLLKVIFVLSFLVTTALLVTLSIIESSPYTVVDYNKSTFKCLAGNEKTFALWDNVIYRDYLEVDEVIKFCDLSWEYKLSTDYDYISLSDTSGAEERRKLIAQERQRQQEIIDLVEFNMVNKTIGSWWQTVGLVILLVFGIAISFEILRRLFYYIVLGSFKPTK